VKRLFGKLTSGGQFVWLPEKSGKFHNLGLTLRPSGNIRNRTTRNQ
jgi:hypothetical protein